MNKKFEEATYDFGMAIKLQPLNSARYYVRSSHYLNSNHYELALIDISKAIELEPTNTLYLSFRADLYDNHLNANELAVADYEMLIGADKTIDQQDVNYLRLLGTIYEESGELEKANMYFNQGVKFSDQFPIEKSMCLWNKGLIALKVNQVDSALFYNNKAIDLNPNEETFLYQNAEIFLYYKNDLEKAEEYIKSAIKISPDNTDFLNEKSMISFKKNDLKDAIKTISKIIEIDPQNAEAYCLQIQ